MRTATTAWTNPGAKSSRPVSGGGNEEERRELVRKRRLHLQRRAEAAKKRAQHLRTAAAARAVDEQREKVEREAKDAVFEKPPPVPPVSYRPLARDFLNAAPGDRSRRQANFYA